MKDDLVQSMEDCESHNLETIKTLEKIAWTASMSSFAAQFVTTAATYTPSGLEEYLHNPFAATFGVLLTFGGLLYARNSMDKSPGCYAEKNLVIENSHSVVRHPIYLGFRLTSVGAVLLNPSLENLVAAGIFMLTSELSARSEENKLNVLYRDEFKEYSGRVPRWIPYSNHVTRALKTTTKYVFDIFRNQVSTKE